MQATRCVHLVGLGLLALRFLLLSSSSSASSDAQAAPCNSPHYRDFDFWLGDWDVFEIDGTTRVTHTVVQRALDGCAIREVYESADGMHGESLSAYDMSRLIWQQSWFTNRGQLLVIEGKLVGGAMVLEGRRKAREGEEIVRGTWKPASGAVRETAIISTDGGKTWRPWFDLMFRKHTN